MPKYTGDKFGFGKSPDGGGGSSGPDPNYSIAKSATFTQTDGYTWVVPAGVTSVSVLCVGGGGSGGGSSSNAGCGGGGGAMVWGNNISVTPGESIQIVVGAGGRPPIRAQDPLGRSYPGGNGEGGGQSYFKSNTLLVALGGDGGSGGSPGQGGTWSGSLATMGYNGGTGGNYTNGNSPNNGGGGGAPGNYVADGADGETNDINSGGSGGGGGGGVGLQGTGGTGKYTPRWTSAAERALGGGRRGNDNFTKGGSGTFSAPWGQYSGRFMKDYNSNAQSLGAGGTGGWPGGGGGGNGNASNGGGGRGRNGYGADGAVRIVWGGRTFPDEAHDVDQPSAFLLGGDYYYTGGEYTVGTYVDCDFKKPVMDQNSTNFIGNSGNPLEFGGVSKIVLNGYGILFYGWHSHHTGNTMHEIELPEFLLNKDIDITFIGGGGYHSGGGGGGGAGAGGGRWYGELTNLTAYIKTGTNYFSNFQGSNWKDGGPAFTNPSGNSEMRSTRMFFNNGTEDLYGPNAGDSQGSIAQGGNVYNYNGPNSNAGASLANSDATKLAYIQSVDPLFEYCYGGCGVFLNGFNNNSPWYTGSDLGGGGGAQNAWQYGGDQASYDGGRFGYRGARQFGDAQGPVGGMTLNDDGSYPKGGGGSFGAGCGDAGNNDNVATPGGGAILIRWDTTLATAQDNGSPGTRGFPGKMCQF